MEWLLYFLAGGVCWVFVCFQHAVFLCLPVWRLVHDYEYYTVSGLANELQRRALIARGVAPPPDPAPGTFRTFFLELVDAYITRVRTRQICRHPIREALQYWY